MTWAERVVDWMAMAVIRRTIKRVDAKTAAAILASIEEKPFMLRFVRWRAVQELRHIADREN